jgi:hypothetical protein
MISASGGILRKLLEGTNLCAVVLLKRLQKHLVSEHFPIWAFLTCKNHTPYAHTRQRANVSRLDAVFNVIAFGAHWLKRDPKPITKVIERMVKKRLHLVADLSNFGRCKEMAFC